MKLIKRLYWLLVNPFRRMYWFLFRPKTRGVKCFILHGEKILFVRISYAHKGWTVPGGRVDKNEPYLDAAIREVQEEVGIKLNNPVFFFEYQNLNEYKIDTVQCFYEKVESSDFYIDDCEIIEAKWASVNEIPKPHGLMLEKIISKLTLLDK